MTYQTLTAGATREAGDEQQNKGCPETKNRFGYRSQWAESPGSWVPVCLVGHQILASDLLHLNFRRPVK